MGEHRTSAQTARLPKLRKDSCFKSVAFNNDKDQDIPEIKKLKDMAMEYDKIKENTTLKANIVNDEKVTKTIGWRQLMTKSKQVKEDEEFTELKAKKNYTDAT